MVRCEKCGSEKYVKNGKARGQQKYLFKECGYNFTERTEEQTRK